MLAGLATVLEKTTYPCMQAKLTGIVYGRAQDGRWMVRGLLVQGLAK